jgi:hypothetical protein
MRLYRSMKTAADGLPAVGPSARTLGIRPGVDCPAADTRPGDGGMSVAPDDPMNLARIRRPGVFGGTGSDPVWYIESDDLGPDLIVRQDSPTHSLIEPAREVTASELQRLIAATRGRWKLATPGDEPC